MNASATTMHKPKTILKVAMSTAALASLMLPLAGCPAGNPNLMSQTETDAVIATSNLVEGVVRRNDPTANRLGGEGGGGGGGDD